MHSANAVQGCGRARGTAEPGCLRALRVKRGRGPKRERRRAAAEHGASVNGRRTTPRPRRRAQRGGRLERRLGHRGRRPEQATPALGCLPIWRRTRSTAEAVVEHARRDALVGIAAHGSSSHSFHRSGRPRRRPRREHVAIAAEDPRAHGWCDDARRAGRARKEAGRAIRVARRGGRGNARGLVEPHRHGRELARFAARRAGRRGGVHRRHDRRRDRRRRHGRVVSRASPGASAGARLERRVGRRRAQQPAGRARGAGRAAEGLARRRPRAGEAEQRRRGRVPRRAAVASK